MPTRLRLSPPSTKRRGFASDVRDILVIECRRPLSVRYCRWLTSSFDPAINVQKRSRVATQAAVLLHGRRRVISIGIIDAERMPFAGAAPL